jgi:hypothetical protein
MMFHCDSLIGRVVNIDMMYEKHQQNHSLKSDHSVFKQIHLVSTVYIYIYGLHILLLLGHSYQRPPLLSDEISDTLR